MSSELGRLPLRSSRRIRARDAKLLAREEAVSNFTGVLKRACPCNVCISGVRDVLLRKTVRKHLLMYGRHPFNRGSTQVSALECFCKGNNVVDVGLVFPHYSAVSDANP